MAGPPERVLDRFYAAGRGPSIHCRRGSGKGRAAAGAVEVQLPARAVAEHAAHRDHAEQRALDRVLQRQLAAPLLERKAENINLIEADLLCAGNIGCLEQIARGIDLPVVHTVELLDWATGGPKPERL